MRGCMRCVMRGGWCRAYSRFLFPKSTRSIPRSFPKKKKHIISPFLASLPSFLFHCVVSLFSPASLSPNPLLPLLHWRRSSRNLAPMRVPRRHQQIHHYPKDVPRHALPSHSTHIGQGGAELPPLFLLLALGLTILQRHQRHARQGLPLVHPCLQTGRVRARKQLREWSRTCLE